MVDGICWPCRALWSVPRSHHLCLTGDTAAQEQLARSTHQSSATLPLAVALGVLGLLRVPLPWRIWNIPVQRRRDLRLKELERFAVLTVG